jgi:hypothetical protein
MSCNRKTDKQIVELCEIEYYSARKSKTTFTAA